VDNINTALREADTFFISGGNTFRLLDKLYSLRIINIIHERIVNGKVNYIGVSAGCNIACPTIRTTNDMPIIYPPSFSALNLIGFQINPHYFDSDPTSKHMGETRDNRIKEYHEENDLPVIGLYEGSWLKVSTNKVTLYGTNGAKIFRKDGKTMKVISGCSFDLELNFLAE
jgi:dipeptidase E